MVETTKGIHVSKEMVYNYFSALVNHFFKILPMFESGEDTFPTYLESLQVELLGCKDLICSIGNDPYYLVLLSILEYFINNPDITKTVVKREVFRAISICNRLKFSYCKEEKDECVE